MEKIENKEIKMKSKWWFFAKTTSLRGIILLNILLCSIILSATVYLVSLKTPLELFSYGNIGMEIFFNDFPYIWLISAVVLIISGTILLSKVGDNYRKTTKTVLAINIVFIIIATLIFGLLKNSFNLESWLGRF